MTDDRDPPAPLDDAGDDALFELVRSVMNESDPVPEGAVEFAAGAWAWRDVDVELAELLHDSGSDAPAVAVRDAAAARVVMFRAGDVSLEAERSPDGLFGAVTPAGRYRVDVYDGGEEVGRPAAATAVTDDGGLFRLPGDLVGTLRFVVTGSGGAVVLVSPWSTW